MTRSVKVSMVLIAVFAVALASFVFWSSSNSGASAAAEDAADDPAAVAVRENSHRLSDPPESRATFVEFLDFECEACRAAYPAVEQLRETYGDTVTFVVRYFPIPSHANAERAARAVEAAAQQGRFEAMYQRMYETQAQWGEQQAPMDNLFREFGAGLGLDMTAYDAAYDDPATLERIRADVADGQALGVQGTPTFFVDGVRVEATDISDLTDALDAALR
ncbi:MULTISPECIES: DsbA family protein [unclassified Rhodococcus (in: high G+C Gram-positive bacteria)]|uniref:DsbA family protein n=1 Tax=unclassified Rhodococcus (in: high G+C Gram-positive bacteria) TaxID=192944 RepID=UPI002E2BD712|nr:thioredoxin domain-containing protein [Rhodococcus sp. NBC_00294]